MWQMVNDLSGLSSASAGQHSQATVEVISWFLLTVQETVGGSSPGVCLRWWRVVGLPRETAAAARRRKLGDWVHRLLVRRAIRRQLPSGVCPDPAAVARYVRPARKHHGSELVKQLCLVRSIPPLHSSVATGI